MLLRDLGAILDWQSRAVARRHALVFRRTWKTAFFPSATEPVFYLFAFGLGLGSLVPPIAIGDGRTVPFVSWYAAGLLAYASFTTPFFEGLYAAYIRMFYQKTWDGMLATQVEIRHVVWGEILWCSMRGAANTTVVALVLAAMDSLGVVQLHAPSLLLAPPLALLCGMAFGAFGLLFTAIVPSIDHMNYPTFLVGIPLGMASETFFPLAPEHPALRVLLELNPIRHLARTLRGLLLGGLEPRTPLLLAATTVFFLALFASLAHRLVRKRIVG